MKFDEPDIYLAKIIFRCVRTMRQMPAVLVMAKTAQNAIKNTSWRVPSVLRISHQPQVLELNNKK